MGSDGSLHALLVCGLLFGVPEAHGRNNVILRPVCPDEDSHPSAFSVKLLYHVISLYVLSRQRAMMWQLDRCHVLSGASLSLRYKAHISIAYIVREQRGLLGP